MPKPPQENPVSLNSADYPLNVQSFMPIGFNEQWLNLKHHHPQQQQIRDTKFNLSKIDLAIVQQQNQNDELASNFDDVS